MSLALHQLLHQRQPREKILFQLNTFLRSSIISNFRFVRKEQATKDPIKHHDYSHFETKDFCWLSKTFHYLRTLGPFVSGQINIGLFNELLTLPVNAGFYERVRFWLPVVLVFIDSAN